MIKNIIFDMGGVLIDFDPVRSVSNHFAPEDRDAVLANTFRSKEWALMDKGDLSVEEALNKMNSRLPERLHAEVRKMVIERELICRRSTRCIRLLKLSRRMGTRSIFFQIAPIGLTISKKVYLRLPFSTDLSSRRAIMK